VLFDAYDPGDFYDELFVSKGQPRLEASLLIKRVNAMSLADLKLQQQAVQNTLFKLGVTFNVYSDNQGTERIFPFDVIPRIVSGQEWQWLEKGLKQRIYALNCFIHDVYNDQKILKDDVVPRHVVESAPGYLPPCMGLKPPENVWCHITGTDLVRDKDGSWYVLEDNLRCPSGVSYVLENRRVMKNTFPHLFSAMDIAAVDDYASQLLESLLNLVPSTMVNPRVVVLSPGIYNSAYFRAFVSGPANWCRTGRRARFGGVRWLPENAHYQRVGAGRCGISPD
jgi:uncharacterized circularly permuted ATP-grasp superfamily protein